MKEGVYKAPRATQVQGQLSRSQWDKYTTKNQMTPLADTQGWPPVTLHLEFILSRSLSIHLVVSV